MTSATMVHEAPSLRREWRMNGGYDVVMHMIIIILNIAAILYMRKHKIPLDDQLWGPLIDFTACYFAGWLISCAFWCTAAIEDVSLPEALCIAYIMGRVCHTLGFCIFLGLLYSISHRLPLYFGLPCSLWLLPAMIAPCCPCLWRGEQAWWKFVNQPPESADTIV
ncbi:unnamed protein product [Arabis nemorensis]|uniref:Uncharacterized protein n=1 Tax=Arabis nemorensis TaxID=586526 RepID=A0A565ARD2_9BRAS|nr:unnamed protein product [Arabis nemorensis]